MSKLVITKALTRTADNYANKQAHVELAARIKKRARDRYDGARDRPTPPPPHPAPPSLGDRPT